MANFITEEDLDIPNDDRWKFAYNDPGDDADNFQPTVNYLVDCGNHGVWWWNGHEILEVPRIGTDAPLEYKTSILYPTDGLPPKDEKGSLAHIGFETTEYLHAVEINDRTFSFRRDDKKRIQLFFDEGGERVISDAGYYTYFGQFATPAPDYYSASLLNGISFTPHNNCKFQKSGFSAFYMLNTYDNDRKYVGNNIFQRVIFCAVMKSGGIGFTSQNPDNPVDTQLSIDANPLGYDFSKSKRLFPDVRIGNLPEGIRRQDYAREGVSFDVSGSINIFLNGKPQKSLTTLYTNNWLHEQGEDVFKIPIESADESNIIKLLANATNPNNPNILPADPKEAATFGVALIPDRLLIRNLNVVLTRDKQSPVQREWSIDKNSVFFGLQVADLNLMDFYTDGANGVLTSSSSLLRGLPFSFHTTVISMLDPSGTSILPDTTEFPPMYVIPFSDNTMNRYTIKGRNFIGLTGSVCDFSPSSPIYNNFVKNDVNRQHLMAGLTDNSSFGKNAIIVYWTNISGGSAKPSSNSLLQVINLEDSDKGTNPNFKEYFAGNSFNLRLGTEQSGNVITPVLPDGTIKPIIAHISIFNTSDPYFQAGKTVQINSKTDIKLIDFDVDSINYVNFTINWGKVTSGLSGLTSVPSSTFAVDQLYYFFPDGHLLIRSNSSNIPIPSSSQRLVGQYFHRGNDFVVTMHAADSSAVAKINSYSGIPGTPYTNVVGPDHIIFQVSRFSTAEFDTGNLFNVVLIDVSSKNVSSTSNKINFNYRPNYGVLSPWFALGNLSLITEVADYYDVIYGPKVIMVPHFQLREVITNIPSILPTDFFYSLIAGNYISFDITSPHATMHIRPRKITPVLFNATNSTFVKALKTIVLNSGSAAIYENTFSAEPNITTIAPVSTNVANKIQVLVSDKKLFSDFFQNGLGDINLSFKILSQIFASNYYIYPDSAPNFPPFYGNLKINPRRSMNVNDFILLFGGQLPSPQWDISFSPQTNFSSWINQATFKPLIQRIFSTSPVNSLYSQEQGFIDNLVSNLLNEFATNIGNLLILLLDGNSSFNSVLKHAWVLTQQTVTNSKYAKADYKTFYTDLVPFFKNEFLSKLANPKQYTFQTYSDVNFGTRLSDTFFDIITQVLSDAGAENVSSMVMLAPLVMTRYMTVEQMQKYFLANFSTILTANAVEHMCNSVLTQLSSYLLIDLVYHWYNIDPTNPDFQTPFANSLQSYLTSNLSKLPKFFLVDKPVVRNTALTIANLPVADPGSNPDDYGFVVINEILLSGGTSNVVTNIVENFPMFIRPQTVPTSFTGSIPPSPPISAVQTTDLLSSTKYTDSILFTSTQLFTITSNIDTVHIGNFVSLDIVPISNTIIVQPPDKHLLLKFTSNNARPLFFSSVSNQTLTSDIIRHYKYTFTINTPSLSNLTNNLIGKISLVYDDDAKTEIGNSLSLIILSPNNIVGSSVLEVPPSSSSVNTATILHTDSSNLTTTIHPTNDNHVISTTTSQITTSAPIVKPNISNLLKNRQIRSIAIVVSVIIVLIVVILIIVISIFVKRK